MRRERYGGLSAPPSKISMFMVHFIPPNFEVLGLLWFEVFWAFRKVNLIGKPLKELGCCFLRCLCQITHHSSICFPSSPKCVDVLHLLLSPLLLSLSLWIYTFFPPISMVGFWEEVVINESTKFSVFNQSSSLSFDFKSNPLDVRESGVVISLYNEK